MEALCIYATARLFLRCWLGRRAMTPVAIGIQPVRLECAAWYVGGTRRSGAPIVAEAEYSRQPAAALPNTPFDLERMFRIAPPKVRVFRTLVIY